MATDGTGDYNCASDRTDCDTEINNALSYINSIGGGIVHIKSGTYVINATMLVYDNTTVEGDGATATIIKLIDNAGWWSDRGIFESANNKQGGLTRHNITFQIFEIDGNRDNQSEPGGDRYYPLIWLGQTGNVTIQNMTLINTKFDQIRVGGTGWMGCNTCIVQDSTFANGGHAAIDFLSSENITVRRNTISVRSNAGVRFTGVKDSVISDNTISGGNNSQYGIELSGYGNSVTSNNTIQNNTIHDQALAGIALLANIPTDSSKATGTMIKNNRIYHNGFAKSGANIHGIFLSNFTDTSIINNSIYNNYGSGIAFTNYTGWAQVSWNMTATVRNNIISGNTQYGISVLIPNASINSTYNLYFDNSSGANDSNTTLGLGDINGSDPQYYNTIKRTSWDGYGFNADLDFHLKSQAGRWNGTSWVTDSVTSPAIDAGDPTDSYNNEPSLNGSRINMGAYGNTTEASKTYTSPTPTDTPTPTPLTPSSTSGSSSASSSSTSAPSCGDQAPGTKAPWLYGAIAQDSSSVLLYFTQADNPVNKYVLEYGTKSGDYPYGVQDMGVNSRGQMTFLVKSLSSNTTYYFRVRGGNDCAAGSWSNEISARTKGLVSINQLDITQSELEYKPVEETPPTTTACQTYTVKSGDGLWSIAENLLGDGNKYKEIIEQNKDKYPSLETSNNLEAGWELKVNCGKQTTSETQNTPATEAQGGYDVKVKVVDTNKKPVGGAKITIHSKIQEALTNKDGIAEFKNVEAGDHKVLIAYNNFEGEQSVNLTGNVKEFDLNPHSAYCNCYTANFSVQQIDSLTYPCSLSSSIF